LHVLPRHSSAFVITSAVDVGSSGVALHAHPTLAPRRVLEFSQTHGVARPQPRPDRYDRAINRTLIAQMCGFQVNVAHIIGCHSSIP